VPFGSSVAARRRSSLRKRAQLGGLGLPLLDPVLAERGEAGRDRGRDSLGSDGLADRDDLDRRRVPTGARRRLGDSREDSIARAREAFDLQRVDRIARLRGRG
jgi:hypothetical protein